MDEEAKRVSCDCVLGGCSTALQLEEGNTNLFDQSAIKSFNSICFRGKTSTAEDSDLYLFIIPVADCWSHRFLNQQAKKNLNGKKNKRKFSSDILFNHLRHHTFPNHFQLLHRLLPKKHAGLLDASWVLLGSTIYFFGSTSRKIFYVNRYVVDTAFTPSSLRIKKAGRMMTKRREPKVVALDGKIYVFGSSSEEGLSGEVFKPNRESFEGQSKALDCSIKSTTLLDVSFVVAIEKEKKIIVGFYCTLGNDVDVELFYQDIEKTLSIVVRVYDVKTKHWSERENIILNHRGLQCQPIAVDSCLYWLDKKLYAYDLKTRQYYEGPIEDCFLQHVLETGETKYRKYMTSLLHVFEDFLCLTWSNGDDSILHCTMIRATKTNNNLQANNRFELRTIVVSCETFDSELSEIISFPALRL